MHFSDKAAVRSASTRYISPAEHWKNGQDQIKAFRAAGLEDDGTESAGHKFWAGPRGRAITDGLSISVDVVTVIDLGVSVPSILKSVGSKALAETVTLEESAAFRKVSTGGTRNEIPLSAQQKAELVEYSEKYGILKEDIHFSDESATSYKLLFGEKDYLNIGTDVFPNGRYNLTANSRITSKGAIAHELEGHRLGELAGKTHPDGLLEEAQASIRAARFGKDLNSTERVTLLRDALERLHNNNLKIRDVKHKLWIN